MFAANSYRIRLATAEDTDTLRALAERNAEQPLHGRVLIGEINGAGAAALSLSNGRVIADSSPRTAHLVANLRVRAVSIWTAQTAPSLRGRMIAGLPVWYRAAATPVQVSAADEQSPEPQPVLIHA